MRLQIRLFHEQKIHGNDTNNMPEFTKPQLVRTEFENILRWEDDGGTIVDPPFYIAPITHE